MKPRDIRPGAPKREPSFAQNVQHNIGPSYSCGVVIALKDNFGFIQLLGNVERQVYFSQSDLLQSSSVDIGAEVCFQLKQGNRGEYADRVRVLNSNQKKYVYPLVGIVLVEPGTNRNTPGLISLTDETLAQQSLLPALMDINFPGNHNEIPFFGEDIDFSGQKIRRLNVGDKVSFTLMFLPKALRVCYARAVTIKIAQRKQDRIIDEQIQRMLSAGLKREQGVVKMIRANDFGFIQVADQVKEVYFRMDDINLESIEDVKEGTAFEFFIINEFIRGKIADRAVHLTLLPPGSVRIEELVTRSAIATVTSTWTNDSKTQRSTHISVDIDPNPDIGSLRLLTPILTSQTSPSQLLTKAIFTKDSIANGVNSFDFKVGDVIECDIVYYRPRQAFEARNIVLKSCSPFGREFGTIVGLKNDRFGFIRSFIRDIDIYFVRTSVVSDNTLKIGDVVSFDIILNDNVNNNNNNSNGNNNGSSFQADRVTYEFPSRIVRLFRDVSFSVYNPASYLESMSSKISDDSKFDPFTYLRLQFIANDVVGNVSKEPVKRDNNINIGQIEMYADFYSRVSNMNSLPLDVVKMLRDFVEFSEIRDMSLSYLTTSQRKIIHKVVETLFPQIEHLTVVNSEENQRPTEFERILILRKKTNGNGISNHIDINIQNLTISDPIRSQKIVVDNEEDNNDDVTKKSGDDASVALIPNIVNFDREDFNTNFGPLAKDLEVVFSLYFDRKTWKYVAKEVRLTDRPLVPPHRDCFFNTFVYGVVDTTLDSRSGYYGFVRTIPSDEKLFWHSNSIAPIFNSMEIRAGQEVIFEVRLRGSMRCAANIFMIDTSKNSQLELVNPETVPRYPVEFQQFSFLVQRLCSTSLPYRTLLPARCIAVVVSETHAVFVDAEDRLLREKFWDIDILNKSLTRDESSWSHAGGSQSAADATKDNINRSLSAFASLPRIPILMDFAMGDISPQSVKVGDVISCQAVFNFPKQRLPVSLVGMTKLAGVESLKLSGFISRSKIKAKLESNNSNESSAFEYCEITVDSQSTNATSNTSAINTGSARPYFCNLNDIVALNQQQSLRMGDIVEFYAIREVGKPATATSKYQSIGFSPTRKVVAESKLAPTIIAKKSVVSAASGNPTASSGGFNSIIMAKGPTNESSTGFEAGWRPVPSIDNLPWKNLLSHLSK